MTKSKPKQAAQETVTKQTAPKTTKRTKLEEPSNVVGADNAPKAQAQGLSALSAETEPGTVMRAEPTPEMSAESAAPKAQAPAAPPAREPEPLHLPRGAFIAFRKSGGAEFSTREVVLYPDGRVAFDARGVPQKEYNRLRRALNDGQVLALRKLLDQTNFWHTESAVRQNLDAFAYEIAARLGQRANSIQVFEGSVPEKLEPLLERLTPLLPQE
jgi:hypothetical protein